MELRGNTKGNVYAGISPLSGTHVVVTIVTARMLVVLYDSPHDEGGCHDPHHQQHRRPDPVRPSVQPSWNPNQFAGRLAFRCFWRLCLRDFASKQCVEPCRFFGIRFSQTRFKAGFGLSVFEGERH
jgi:hypothetical protein